MRSLLRTLLTATAGLALCAASASAQGAARITGRVTSDNGAPLPLASVSIPSLGIGAYTDDGGLYSIQVPGARVPSGSVAVTVRRVGYSPKTVQVTLAAGGSVEQDFVLTTLPNVLSGVVVTALGVQMEKSQLGTAQQQVSSGVLNSTHDANVVNELAGKVAGVTITGSGTQGGSSNITIRGSNSIGGNNTPLFIVDGVPVSTADRGGSVNGAYDFGSAINDLNPDDIASVTVLKGPNAAALYGSRAANGVILITTKTGSASGGKVNTSYTSSYSFDTPSITPTFQNLYGQGAGGQFSFVDGQGGGIQDGNDQSFGPRLDGRIIDQFTCPTGCPWVAHPNNVSSFFQTGGTFDNNLSFSGGTDRASARVSVGTDDSKGYIPNNSFQKFSAALSGQLQVSSRLSTSASLNYINNQALNRPGTGYNVGILEGLYVWFGRQVDMNALRHEFYQPNGSLYNWNYNYHNNPFWIQYDNPEHDVRNRMIGNVSATYKLTDWLDVTARTGSDIYNYNQSQEWAGGNLNFADPAYSGAFAFQQTGWNENNSEVLATLRKTMNSHLAVNVIAGANRRFSQYNYTSQSTAGISVPWIYNVSNAAITPTLNQNIQNLQVNSAYGSASFTWDDWWTVEGTARNDWSSTLPRGHNSYFYPSVNTSLVLTNMIPSLKSSFLSYFKLRGSVAQVGADASPYQLATTYSGSSAKFSGLPLYSISSTISNPTLKPEITQSGEAGVELGLFDDRASLDMSYYRKATRNQIINLTLAPTTGFANKSINAGKIVNAGFEAQLNVTPIQTNNFQWNATFNYSTNANKVVSLYPGLTTIVLNSSWYQNVEARVGQPYGTLFGYTFLRDSATHKLITLNGLPQIGPRKVLGNVNPLWIGSWNNEFKYKRWTLSGLLDYHVGGSIFSVTNMFGQYTGVLASTIKGREVDWNKPGVVVQGIDGNTGQPNTVNRTAEDYYQSLFAINEAFIYSATYLKLRELRLGYDLTPNQAHRFWAQSVNIAFVGRNLLASKKIPNVDPEFAYASSTAGLGMEFANLPNTLSWGFNVRIVP
ncbi:MAG TPA: SusC/RagA family TonB-linked outer membrane protein [Gemmatimonadaceae bacterium]|nr:SusC/RagA family TonB-linked outer membrane protein [Gemmatimonadaceae bacterium]